MATQSSLGVVFPGQGSQSMGMLSGLAESQPMVRETFEEASEAIGLDLWQIAQQGPAEVLNRTDNTQPALLAAGVAAWRVWRANDGPLPAVMAGHSLGEYTALVCARALDFAEAVRIVRDRGRFMQAAVPEGEGAMAAILGLADEDVRSVCEIAAQGELVEAVNYNAPGQVVIAGTRTAVDRAIDQARQAGAKKAMALPVSVPSHCALMDSAAEQLDVRLADVILRTPSVPVLHNVDVTVAATADDIRDRLVRQLCKPVRWVATIERMQELGVERLVEAGPGRVLCGLNRRIARRMPAQPLLDVQSLEKALATETED